MSVEFSNTYQEILLDNLVSIIKQNFIFQTQLKLAEGGNKDKAELQEKYDTLFSQYESLKSQTPELEALRLRVDTNAGAHEEKSRIQSALNDEMKKSVELKGQLEVKSSELATKTQENADLRNQILKLESLIPVSKPKKSNSVFDPIESTPLTPSSSKGKDGSTF
jgi:chromosome segregation ATPase